MFLTVHSRRICSPGQQVLDHGLVAADDSEVQRGVTLIVWGVQQGGAGRQDATGTFHAHVLGTVMQGMLARGITLLGDSRLQVGDLK